MLMPLALCMPLSYDRNTFPSVATCRDCRSVYRRVAQSCIHSNAECCLHAVQHALNDQLCALNTGMLDYLGSPRSLPVQLSLAKLP
jgi:hypothetical protein